MRRNITIILLTLLLVGSAGLIFIHNREPEVKNIHSSGTTIVAFGDSLTEGVGASNKNLTWPALVSKEVKADIINAGRAGDTTVAARARVRGDVLIHDPWLVIVFLGGNDIQRVAVQETFGHIEDIIEEIQKAGAAVLLIGIRGGTLQDPYEKEFGQLSRRYGAAYIPDFMAKVFTDPKLHSEDRIHPNDAGYQFIAERIAPELQRLLKLRTKR